MSIDQRPWGGYRILLEESGFKVKRIEIKPGLRFSLQKHSRRAERWVVTSGQGIATIGEKEVPVSRGSVVEIGQGQVHRLQNTGTEPLVVIEVQIGDYFGEDDIVRLADDFSRK